MTTARKSVARSSLRGAAVALMATAGIALTTLPASANAGGGGGAAVAAAPAAASSGKAQIAVNTALAQRGDPYVWGATGPNAFDCSGLTTFAYKAAGITIPRTSKAQAGFGTPVSKAALQPGDLVFFNSPVSHVGMYIGNGQMVHAPTPGQTVKTIKLDSMPGFVGARRIA
ncbi:C40 family peptidase [Geodermatophilus ruber]|uniref:Cell wall-associated hydrolase, NlpC family n=1 Tax=Geodermatophilus ruber TaxID=504800 RepID=A0A1I4H8D9_9ACTN|nr:Cell wall-associated hydrolase, NlpC family [Geodermatophilus ruber]